MRAIEVWFRCREMGVTLTANRPSLKYCGPQGAVEQVVPLIRRHTGALLDLVESLDGLPVEDGPFTPYMPSVSAGMLREWQSELMTLFARCARDRGLEDDAIQEMRGTLYRMPVYTVWIDLVHYREYAASLDAQEVSNPQMQGEK